MLCEVAILMVVMDLPVPFLHVYRGHRTLHFIQHHIYVSAASFPRGDGGKQQTGIDKYVMQTISKKIAVPVPCVMMNPLLSISLVREHSIDSQLL
jgi:hypothetical protein